MKKIKYCLTLMLLACTTMSFAQFSNGGSKSSTADNEAWKGLRFSYDLTQPRYTGSGDFEGDFENYNGFTIGYVHAFNVAKIPLFIETGAGISFARYNISEGDLEYKETLLGLRIPVNLVYKVQINDKLAIKPFTGIYLRANLMGKAKESYDDNSVSWNLFDKDDMGDDATYNRVQAGWQIGATLDVNKFNVGIGYALDFNEIAENVKMGIFSVNVGYNF